MLISKVGGEAVSDISYVSDRWFVTPQFSTLAFLPSPEGLGEPNQ